MVNILDKAIAAVSPIAGYRRATARAALSILNNGTGYGNYGASHTSRAMRAGTSAADRQKRTSRTTLIPCASGAGMLTWVSLWRLAH